MNEGIRTLRALPPEVPVASFGGVDVGNGAAPSVIAQSLLVPITTSEDV